MMTTARTKEELDAYCRDVCGNPKCKVEHVMVFMCDKHVDAPVCASYQQGSGLLEISCAICDETLGVIEVASREMALAV